MQYIFLLVAFLASANIYSVFAIEHPTLPVLWVAETIEPGSPGDGMEAYRFVDKPTPDNPSALWSNYTDCQRLIYIPNGYDGKRYLLGCDAVDCCYEEQDGNHVEFQIPNVHYSNPSKKVEVSHQRVNITNFGKEIEADEWSWEWKVKDILSQEWRAYTIECSDCVNGTQLLQWQSRAMESEWFSIQFKNYKGYLPSSDEGKEIINSFNIPSVCQRNNLLECPSGLHAKYFEKKVNGGRQSECNVAKYLRNAGFPSNTIGTMVCISKYESSWNCDATNKNVDGSTDYGLFEINSYYWCSGDPTSKYNECGTSCSSLMDCQRNTNCAYRVYKEQGFNAWYGYQYHKSECDNYPTPVCEEMTDVYAPVDNVDLSMYSGRWYQVYKDYFDMTFQGQGTCAVADYTIVENKVQVVNSQINKNGDVGQINGYAFYENNNSGGKLSVMLDGVPKTMPYWIIELGPIVNNKYEYSIVSDDKQISLFVLTRNVEDFYKKYDKDVKERLKELGFNKKINEPIEMEQKKCDYSLYNQIINDTEKCCDTCPEGKDKYYSIPLLSKDHCGESCIEPEHYKEYRILEPMLRKAETNSPCLDKGFIYENTEQHGFGPVKIAVDLYKQKELQSNNCGTCGTAYQTCCIGFAVDGYPCDCHLQEGGSGKAGSDCGDCGTAYAACCIGYAADGYPCECDVA